MKSKGGRGLPRPLFLLLLFPAQCLEVISNFGRTPDENLPQADGFTVHPRGLSDLHRTAAFVRLVSLVYIRKEHQESMNVDCFACAEVMFTVLVLRKSPCCFCGVNYITFSLRSCRSPAPELVNGSQLGCLSSFSLFSFLLRVWIFHFLYPSLSSILLND